MAETFPLTFYYAQKVSSSVFSGRINVPCIFFCPEIDLYSNIVKKVEFMHWFENGKGNWYPWQEYGRVKMEGN